MRPLQPKARPDPGGPDLGVHPAAIRAGHKPLAVSTILRMTATAPAKTVQRYPGLKEPLGIRIVWTSVGQKLHLALPGWGRTYCQRDIGSDVSDIFKDLGIPLCKKCLEQFVHSDRYRRMALVVDAVRSAVAGGSFA